MNKNIVIAVLVILLIVLTGFCYMQYSQVNEYRLKAVESETLALENEKIARTAQEEAHLHQIMADQNRAEAEKQRSAAEAALANCRKGK